MFREKWTAGHFLPDTTTRGKDRIRKKAEICQTLSQRGKLMQCFVSYVVK
jgi:hypothetical protein